MTMMPYELMQQLPAGIDPEAVQGHVFVGHAPGGGFGETHLVGHADRLHVFSRRSMLGSFEELARELLMLQANADYEPAKAFIDNDAAGCVLLGGALAFFGLVGNRPMPARMQYHDVGL